MITNKWLSEIPIDTLSGLKDWMSDANSFMRRLRLQGFEGQIHVLFEGLATISAEEAHKLDLDTRRHHVREVIISANNQLFMYAKSILSPEFLRHYGERVRELGKLPIGTLLFGKLGFERSRFEYNFHQTSLPMRRSVFYNKQAQLLLTEIFFSEAYVF